MSAGEGARAGDSLLHFMLRGVALSSPPNAKDA